MIKVTAVEKSFKDVKALHGVDFEVERGSIFALLGSNGAGKTTLVRILSTLTTADAGTASVNGADVASDPAGVRESISVTGQSTAVDGILTGRENLMLIARLRHLPDPGGSPTHCSTASGSRRRRGARCPRTPAECAAGWTSP
ncbi:MAG: ATP-binding cassette domain-containing protein [Candidatus Nanopelagicales bacterium]|jgi:ABC-2 type transport system ATP-binding protein